MDTKIRLFVNDNGAICCENHAGQYLKSAITQRPKAKKHKTPIGTFEQLASQDADILSAEFGELCESCR